MHDFLLPLFATLRYTFHINNEEENAVRFNSFDHLLEHHAEVMGDRPALIFEQDGEQRSCSYSSWRNKVLSRSEELRSGGRTCMGILADGSFNCVTEIFAANLAGMQVVLMDPSISPALLREMISYTDVDALWGRDDLCSALSPALTGGVTDGKGKLLFFTSGTTERSKAVVLTDRSLCSSAWNGGEKLPLSPEDRLLCMLPLGHVFGFVCGLLWGLSSGAAVALGRGPRHYIDDCKYFKPTAVSAVPTLLGFLLQNRALNEELKLVLVGAGDCPASLLNAVRAAGIRVCFGYGLTETSSGVAISVSGDPFAMEICPDDEITLAEDGEILVKAPTCVMEGYYKRSEDTQAVLKNGVLYTGDLGRFDDSGRLYITGRKKDMLVLSDGTKLFLPEYEKELAAALGTAELAVVLKNDRPALVVQGEGDEHETMERIRPVLANRPRGQQIARVVFRAEPMPRTATGKLMRWEIQREVDEL